MDRSRLLSVLVLGAFLTATPILAQDRRALVFGDVGYGTIGYADSQQGRAPFVGGGIGFQLTPHFGVDADVHTGRVAHVFGRERHDFSEVTLTGSLVFRAPVGDKAQAVLWMGGGLDWVVGGRVGVGYRF